MSDGSKTDLKKVKELIGLMKENDLVEIEIVDGENKILLKRPQPVAATMTSVPMAMPAPLAAAPAGGQSQETAAS